MCKITRALLLITVGLGGNSFNRTLFGAEPLPSWAQELSSRATPSYPPEVHSVTLLSEEHATVEPNGKLTIRYRHAVKMLSREGKESVGAAIPYVKGASKIKELHAWLIGADGFVKSYGKDKVLDISAAGAYELYNELRVRLIPAGEPEVGATFAWSAEIESSELVPQVVWFFQDREPALDSRYMLTLPDGWKANGTIFNHEPIQASLDGSTYTWELKNLPPIRTEPGSPTLHSIAPWLAVTYFPTAGTGSGVSGLNSWPEVSSWLTNLTDAQAQTDDQMAAKVKEITASAKSPYECIQAIGDYVQHIKYVAIEIDLARGGGYKPHNAPDVLSKQYGDCKDKANLMRAMLKLAGIDSYLLAIYAGDRNHVRREWPSPHQFNHAIIAVRVGDDVQQPSVVAHPGLGRLLLFDPTSTSTPIGALPEYEQGSFALVVAGNRGDLVQVPVAPPESNRTDVNISAALTGDGALTASVHEQLRGQPAASFRDLYSQHPAADFQQFVQRWVSRNAKDVTLSKVSVNDVLQKGQFALDLDFQAPRYAQVMQQRLLVFRPDVVGRWRNDYLQTEPRTTPVVLNGECYRQQIQVTLPPDFKIDEIPEGARFNAGFGSYASTYSLDGNKLVFTQQLDVKASTIPAERYSEVKTFFEHVAGAGQAPLVFVKQ
jgi:transglutaminase-like putative cysteine protease